MVKVDGPPYIWIALCYGALPQRIQTAKADLLGGLPLIRIDHIEAPGMEVELRHPPKTIEPWDNETLYSDSWQFERINGEGYTDYFSSIEVFYLFYPDIPKWVEYFKSSPFIAIPYSVVAAHG